VEILDGKIMDMTPEGLTILVPVASWERVCLRRYDVVQVGLPDGRAISLKQRKKAHACLREIADWVGDTPECIKRLMKLEFVQTRLEALEKEIFSLSNCDVTTAREFITYLIDFMVEHAVPSKVPLYDLCEDISRYVYACLMYKQCAVCGARRSDLHHFDQIGMGSNRNDVMQIGMRVISLCRTCHAKAHDKGKTWLTEDLHLPPIPLTDEIARKYKLTKKNRGITS